MSRAESRHPVTPTNSAGNEPVEPMTTGSVFTAPDWEGRWREVRAEGAQGWEGP